MFLASSSSFSSWAKFLICYDYWGSCWVSLRRMLIVWQSSRVKVIDNGTCVLNVLTDLSGNLVKWVQASEDVLILAHLRHRWGSHLPVSELLESNIRLLGYVILLQILNKLVVEVILSLSLWGTNNFTLRHLINTENRRCLSCGTMNLGSWIQGDT